MTRIHTLRRTALAAGLLLALPVAAQASDPSPLGTNVSRATLKVNAGKVALVEFTERGARRHVLSWGALNVGVGNTRFVRDYSGGWGSKKADWKTFKNVCGRYDGPALNALVTACKAPDGTYWALQDWTKLRDEYGGTTRFRGAATKRELHLSHWKGEIAKLDIQTDWGWHGQWQHLFGRYSYQGRPIHGFKTDAYGKPLDDFGRNLYIDTRNGEGYPAGWSRVNSFVAHKPGGNFCFLFSPKSDRPSFTGTANGWRYSGASAVNEYKVSVLGPGVTPDLVDVPFAGKGVYDLGLDSTMNDLERTYATPDDSCYPDGSKA